jgi:hypothetical protein
LTTHIDDKATHIDDEEDNDEEEEEEKDIKSIVALVHVSGKVSSEISGRKVVRNDTNDDVSHVVYHVLMALELGEHFGMSPKLTEEKLLQVTVIVSVEKEKRRFLCIDDALALSMAQLYHPLWPPPGMPPPPPMSPRPRRTPRSNDEAWGICPDSEPVPTSWAPPPPAAG